jgi:4-hydroxythreonine-4-phosphate dehydrogenase
MSKNKVKVGITIGDPNGIGLEVIMKSLIDTRMLDICTPIIYGSAQILNDHKQKLELHDFQYQTIKDATEAISKKINLINCCQGPFQVEFGKSTEAGGKIAFESLRKATEDIASNKIDVIVTAPINKKNIQSADFPFAGHTEFFANYANEDNPLMLMMSDNIRVGLVSIHLPIKKVAEQISKENIMLKAFVLNKTLIQDFGITRPKIAILGLNPHAGDNGLLGDEEKDIIIPAIEELNQENILAFGPFAADGFFGSSNFKKFDGILAMYHDQGLAPFKALTFDLGVNFTAGLPIVRTSPDHGVGYDIAGQNVASELSFRNAIYTACDVFKQRKEHRTLTSNPLKVSSVETE